MANEDAFLQAIIEEPDDPSLRLIYADWLEEHDDPLNGTASGRSFPATARAEFIRVQFQLQELEETHPRYPELVGREHQLRQQHQATWLEPIKPPLRSGVTFRHGLPERIDLPLVDFLVHAEAVFRLGPIRHVRLTAVRDYLADLQRCPFLGRIEFLDLSDNELRASDLEPVAALLGPQADRREGQFGLDRLTGLSLGANRLGAEGVRLLTRSLWTLRPGLQYLNLNGNRLGAAGAEVLAAWTRFGELTVLHLDENELSAAGIDLLSRQAAGPNPQLRLLSLADNQIPPNGLRLLGQSSRLAALTDLCLARNPLGNEGAESLARSTVLSELRSLDLNTTRMTASGARALAGSAALRHLERLNLAHNQLGQQGAIDLGRSPHLARLQRLDLAGNEIGDDGAKALAASKTLTQLTTLNLSANGIKAFGLKALLVALERLHTLDLQGNKLGNLAVEVLALSPRLAQIRSLNLRNNHIDDDGARALAASRYLSGLRHLDLTSNDISAEGVQALRQVLLSRTPHLDLLLDAADD